MAGKYALIIGNSNYQDAGLRKLIAPIQDVESLARVLRDPNIGSFESQNVKTLLNKSYTEINQAIELFFLDKQPDDLLLLYFSGHGEKYKDGKLCLASVDTQPKILLSTSTTAEFLNRVMRESGAKKQLLILDCCYSGAFTLDMFKAGVEKNIGVRSYFDFRSTGKVLLASSDSVQRSADGKMAGDVVEPSVFTRVLVEGLQSGDADVDGDDVITVDDLSEYVYYRVLEEAPMQEPIRSIVGKGSFAVAKSSRKLRHAEDEYLALKKAEDERLAKEQAEKKRLEREWIVRVGDGFIPKPFASSGISRGYGNKFAPTGRVRLGEEKIPFDLPEHLGGEGHVIVEAHPFSQKSNDVRVIRDGDAKNVIALYVLLSAGNGWKIRGNQKFEGEEIGRLEIYFRDSQVPQIVPLRLGVELREWASGTEGVVSECSASEYVWMSPDRSYTFDLHRVEIKDGPKDVSRLVLVGECKWLPEIYNDSLPSIRISGFTYQEVSEIDARRLTKHKVEVEQLAKEKAGPDRPVQEKIETVRLPKEKAVRERLVSARAEAKRLVQDKIEADRWAKTKQRAAIIAISIIALIAIGVTLNVIVLPTFITAATRTPQPPSQTPAIAPTPTLAIGSTQVSKADGMTQLYVPAGSFTMGSEAGYAQDKPTHTVTLDAFWIDKTEVTNAMYILCVKVGKCREPLSLKSDKRDSYYGNSGFDNYPVIYISWENANAYCGWAGRRLPTEAEWEKAARGTDGRSTYPWGDATPDVNKLNYYDNIKDTTEVGKYPSGASPYGVLDMAGNVWEWVNDWYDENYYRASPLQNPIGPISGQYRTLRGGGWDNVGYDVRVSVRNRVTPTIVTNNIGFRCALSP
ncbi:SUMF1/EgtB/PvdO family nonheme iron enzyme [Candidatus Woesearchaeota archaeon]|nr:SUMF1/EgtB/PvdO family nonheme iron enzyme [Candidatus Woesearchaeota archaeon]